MKKEQAEKKDLRRLKKDRKKDWEERERKRLEGEGGVEGTADAVLRRSRNGNGSENGNGVAKADTKVDSASGGSSDDEDMNEEYKAMKEEEEEERHVKRSRKSKAPTGGMTGSSMFDDL